MKEPVQTALQEGNAPIFENQRDLVVLSYFAMLDDDGAAQRLDACVRQLI